MDTLLIILALVFGIVGLLGAVLPALPGAPLSYIGLLLLLPCEGADISSAALWVTGIFLAIVSILDYIAPAWLTNLSGGGKQATRGSMAGLIAGLFFFPPIGLIVGPFVGAFIGELMEGSSKGILWSLTNLEHKLELGRVVKVESTLLLCWDNITDIVDVLLLQVLKNCI